jgi:hypothetical protein
MDSALLRLRTRLTEHYEYYATPHAHEKFDEIEDRYNIFLAFYVEYTVENDVPKPVFYRRCQALLRRKKAELMTSQ